MYAEQFIAQLGSELGLADLRFNDAQVARLIVGETIVVDLEYLEDRNQIQVYSSLGPPPAGEPPLRELLSANLFGRGTGAAMLALDDEANEIVLCRVLELESLAFRRGFQALEEFVEAALSWTEWLADLERESDPPADAPPAVGREDMLRI